MKTLVALAGIILALALPAASFASGPLVGYWAMDEGQGQIVHDFSGNGNNGVLGATTAIEASDPTWITGGLFGALHFASGQFVTIPDSPSLDPNQMTVLALVRGSSSPGQWKYVLSKGSFGCTSGAYGLYTGFGGGLAFYVYNGTNFYISPEMSTSIWNGKWHVVAGTFDGTTVRLYVDGTQIGAGTTVPLPFQIAYSAAPGGGMIGSYAGNSCNLGFVGDIDEVSIWNTALPISQIFPKVQALLAASLR
jgi:Concanavalin A-like lectin/glucanases superfamily